MLKSAVLILAFWSNNGDGMARDIVRIPMPARACLALQPLLWRIPFETVGHDEFGAIPSHDFACVPENYPEWDGRHG